MAAKAAVAEFDDALTFDLARLRPLPGARSQELPRRRQGRASPPRTINFTNWTNVGADALVKTQLSTDGETAARRPAPVRRGRRREELKVSESVPAQGRAPASPTSWPTPSTSSSPARPGPSRPASPARARRPAAATSTSPTGTARTPSASTNGDVNVLPALVPDGGVAFTSYRSRSRSCSSPRAASPRHADRQRAHGDRRGLLARRQADRLSVADGENAQIYVGQRRRLRPRDSSPTRRSSSTPAPPGRPTASGSPSSRTAPATRRST